MKYMLDTNICIFIIKHKPESVIMKFLSHSPEDLCISAITYAELVHGVEKSQAVAKNRLALSLMLSTISVLDFDADAAVEYGRIRAALEKRGTPMLIAGHAQSKGLTVVTNNTREFRRIEGLCVEDWVSQ